MRILDRYVTSHFARPMLTGVAAFAAILLGVQPMYEAVNLVVQKGLPVSIALQAFILQVPGMVALTVPMATMFASIMASGELSSHGEVVAMRAGGISVARMMSSVVAAGVVIAAFGFGFNELVSPQCNYRATTLIVDYVNRQDNLAKPVSMEIPEEGPVQRWVHADKVNPRNKTMTGVTIVEFDKGKPRVTIYAERAEWRGTIWRLVNVIYKEDTGRGYRESHLKELRYDLGRTPDEIQSSGRRRPEELTLPQLLAEIRATPVKPVVPGQDAGRRLWLLQHLNIRVAAPWAALCFAVLGFPLGLRPHRTSTGVGFGISLAVVFVYYIVINVLRAFGEQGALSPVVAAWAPNVMVLGVGLGLLVEASR